MTARVLPIQNGHNYRELGGYQTQDGRSLKYHKIVRSGHLCDLSTADQQFLTDYGIATDVDFRSKDEVKKGPDKVPAGVDYIFNPVFSTDETESTKSAAEREADMALMDEDPTVGHRRMLHVYHNLITDTHAQKAYRRFFDLLLANDHDHQALLFHCTGGKDRTGLGAYFFLQALNVDPETIRHDYLLTNTVIKDYLNDFINGLKKDGHTQASIANNIAFWGIDGDYLDQAEKDIRDMSGDVQHYLREVLKLTTQEQADLKKIYLTD